MRKRKLALVLGACLGVWIAPAPTHAATLSGCLSLGLAHRSTSPSCWVTLSLPTASVCLTRAQWLDWLERDEAQPLCGEWEGNWKGFSPLLNEPVAHPTARKQVLLRFHALGVPHSPLAGSREAKWTLLRFKLLQRIERIRERVFEWLQPEDRSGMLSLLLTGTQRPGGSAQFLILVGFVHVLAASGIHLYAMARWWNWIFRKLAEQLHIPLRIALPMTQALTAVSWFLIWLLAGARPGMLRPWLVIALRACARQLGFRWLRAAPLGVALALDLLVASLRGEAGIQTGRWIYALANGGGLLAGSLPEAAFGSWILAALWQVHAEGVIALATPLLSALTVPVYTVAVYPLTLVSYLFFEWGWTPAAQVLLRVCNSLATALLTGGTWLALQGSLLWILPAWAWLGGMLVAALSLAATRMKTRMGILALLIAGRVVLGQAAPFARAATPIPGDPLTIHAHWVEQLDVGQGDAALVAPENAATGFGLIDSGSEKSLSDRQWVELLARHQVSKLSWVALTHLDEDHSGGVKRLARLIAIDCVAMSLGELNSVRGMQYREEMMKRGIRVTDWEGRCVPYPTLAPAPGLPGGHKANEAMGAIFVPLQAGGFYLSAGDADAADEPRIGAWAAGLAHKLAMSGRPNSPRILKISHHGSKTSSNPEFIDELKPTTAWISSGIGNSYGHPAVSTLEELQRKGLPVRRTDQQGGLNSEQ